MAFVILQHRRGSAVPTSRLAEDRVRELKTILKAEGKQYGQLARLSRQFGISTTQVAQIRDGKSWAHVVLDTSRKSG